MSAPQTNHGRPFGTLLDDVTLKDLRDATTELWFSVRQHPPDASCECPAIEVLALLYERGYRLVKAEGQAKT